MKTHAVSVRVVLATGVALIVVCAIAQTHAPGTSIHETSVKIHPGTKISSDDLKALDAVLKSYRKSLYKIKTYDRGKLVRTQGSLQDARMDQRLVAEANRASLRGVSYVALQIGNENWPFPASPTPTPVATPTPSDITAAKPPVFHSPPPPPNTAGKIQPLELREMVSRVAPILQKYSQ